MFRFGIESDNAATERIKAMNVPVLLNMSTKILDRPKPEQIGENGSIPKADCAGRLRVWYEEKFALLGGIGVQGALEANKGCVENGSSTEEAEREDQKRPSHRLNLERGTLGG